MKAGDHICVINDIFGDCPIFGKVIETDDIQNAVLIKVFHDYIWAPQEWCQEI